MEVGVSNALEILLVIKPVIPEAEIQLKHLVEHLEQKEMTGKVEFWIKVSL